MRIIKNIIVAFSLYSRIPMPVFEWKEEDMKHNLIFLPWIGAVIGLLSWGFLLLTNYIELPLLARVAVFSLIPLLITGGFHMDGFMDVQDALKSYKSREEKLEILKDPHIGAFSVIRVMIYALIWVASLAVICENPNPVYLKIYFISFILVRATASIHSLKLPHAKKTGMLHMETDKTSGVDFIFSLLQVLLSLALIGYINLILMAVSLAAVIFYSFYYKNLCNKEFGGITGDTAGYSIASLEELLLVLTAIAALILTGIKL